MRLRCVSRYSSHLGTFEPGQVFDVSDAIGGQIQRSSPESFEEVIEREDPLEEAAEQVAAMSTETETGIVAPDRRARGGRKRRGKA